LGSAGRDTVVCVVGAGPAGLVVAHLLEQAGISCVVLERQDATGLRARVKAGLIELRTVELLEPHGLAGTIVERGARNGVCEFRADGEGFVLDYGALCGGRGHYVYPQQELVGDWAESLIARGGEIRFGVRAVGVAHDTERAVVTAVSASGETTTIRCEAVACCHGAASEPVVTGDDAGGVATLGVVYPFRWLTLIAATPPSPERTIYGLHPRGFAGQMRRAATMTRYMLEVPAFDGVDDWPDDRVWPELQRRLAVADRPPLREGSLVEKDVLDLRVRVQEPMQLGRVFFAGDSAHLITPAGGKGMNLAIQEAVELAAGLVDRYGGANAGSRLEGYSEMRLPVVWRYQEFSNLMLTLLHAGGPLDEPGSAAGGSRNDAAFAYRLRRARLERLLDDPQFSRWFAHAYAGVDDGA
jgi:p-hydroxybenzoate 3-monooxygenase